MQRIIAIIAYLYPDIQIDRASWTAAWAAEKQEAVIRYLRAFFAVAAVLYPLHLFVVEIPTEAQNIEKFTVYRFGLGLTYATMFFLTPLLRGRGVLSKLPFWCALGAAGYLQAHSMLWDPRVPWPFSLIVPLIASFCLFEPLFITLIFFAATIFAQSFLHSAIFSSDVLASYYSGILVCLVIIASHSFWYSKSVSDFILRQERAQEVQKRMQMHSDFMDALSTLVSGKIFERIRHQYFDKRLSINQAVDHVLRIRKSFVVVLYTDIRNFTTRSKDLDNYVAKEAIPSIQAIADMSEENGAIVRLIGDLVFSYIDEFDEPSREAMTLRALFLGLETIRLDRLSPGPRDEQRRHVILSCGEALVGNIGGTRGASEITCLGTPANFGARVDAALTREPLKSRLSGQDHLVLDQAMAESLEQTLGICPERVSGVTLKSFPDVRSVAIVPYSEKLRTKIKQRLEEGEEVLSDCA